MFQKMNYEINTILKKTKNKTHLNYALTKKMLNKHTRVSHNIKTNFLILSKSSFATTTVLISQGMDSTRAPKVVSKHLQ